jgi:hypothetical protein
MDALLSAPYPISAPGRKVLTSGREHAELDRAEAGAAGEDKGPSSVSFRGHVRLAIAGAAGRTGRPHG